MRRLLFGAAMLLAASAALAADIEVLRIAADGRDRQCDQLGDTEAGGVEHLDQGMHPGGPDKRELLEAENLLFRQVWYNRHWNLRTAIESGKHKVVTEAEWNKTSPKRKQSTGSSGYLRPNA